MNNIKVYIVGDQIWYADFIKREHSLTTNMNEADVIIFTGGEDVFPGMYDEDTGRYTSYNDERDHEEEAKFKKAKKLKRLMVGICRGAQFLTAMNGGKLVQHVSGHGLAGTHKILIPSENRHIDITSTHHQMMWPFNLPEEDYSIIAHTEGLSSTYLNGWDEERRLPDNFVEPEIVYYPKTNSLCIQGHPESMDKNSNAVKFINLLIDELIEDKSGYVFIDNINDPAPERAQAINDFGLNFRVQAPRPPRPQNVVWDRAFINAMNAEVNNDNDDLNF
jgi:gamma-glutamyl-gamma-aminobutyrate hydrolase PuuD